MPDLSVLTPRERDVAFIVLDLEQECVSPIHFKHVAARINRSTTTAAKLVYGILHAGVLEKDEFGGYQPIRLTAEWREYLFNERSRPQEKPSALAFE